MKIVILHQNVQGLNEQVKVDVIKKTTIGDIQVAKILCVFKNINCEGYNSKPFLHCCSKKKVSFTRRLRWRTIMTLVMMEPAMEEFALR